MATRRAVTASLKMFTLTFAGDVSVERIDLYTRALEDVDDTALAAATVRLVKTHRGEWIPVPAVIREAAGANAVPALDTDELLRAIDRAGTYNPAAGWQSPCVETVRCLFNEHVARAYAEAGGPSRCFADNETTRAIAARDFDRELKATVRRLGPGAVALLSAGQEKALPAGAGAD